MYGSRRMKCGQLEAPHKMSGRKKVGKLCWILLCGGAFSWFQENHTQSPSVCLSVRLSEYAWSSIWCAKRTYVWWREFVEFFVEFVEFYCREREFL